jgi:hypothetical protein
VRRVFEDGLEVVERRGVEGRSGGGRGLGFYWGARLAGGFITLGWGFHPVRWRFYAAPRALWTDHTESGRQKTRGAY